MLQSERDEMTPQSPEGVAIELDHDGMATLPETAAELRALIAQLRAENAALSAQLRAWSDTPVAQPAVEAPDELYRGLIDSMDIGFCVLEMIFDADGAPVDYRFLDANPIFSELTDLTDPIGRHVLELVPELDPVWARTYGEVALTGEPVRFQHQEAAMGNRWFDVYACRIGDPEQRRVALLFTNVTEQKRLERAQQDFVAMVSHDLGNPLAVVRGWAQILHRREAYDAVGIATIIDQTERMERLVADLREFIRLEASRPELRTEPVDLVALVRDAVARARMQAPDRAIQHETGGSLIATVDEDRIGQVLDNLIGNAIKYSPAPSPVTVQVESAPCTARIRVIDQGPGIPADMMSRLFDRFYRGDTREVRGAGLGLYISRMLVNAHGGQLTAESEVGRGSTFLIELPVAATAEPADPQRDR
jgi:signal transduction histidine kinase